MVAYGYWWVIIIPAFIFFAAYLKRRQFLFLCLGIFFILQFMSFGTLAGVIRGNALFWSETLGFSFLLMGILSLYGIHGTLIGGIVGFIYTLWFIISPADWFLRLNILLVLFIVSAIKKTYDFYREKSRLFKFILVFTLSILFFFATYPLAFIGVEVLFPLAERIRALFIIVSFLWAFIALLS